ncbi:MAG: Uma2 family endonuclease [Myxococcales bacterium]|nr:Uma2 family endonuclease [Myxococcales bacterium]
MKRPTIDRVPPGEHVPTADERIVMSNISRDTFEAILRSKGEKRRPKVTYLEGTLELMSPSRQHEQIGRTLGDILNAYFAYLGLEFNNYGSWTVSSSDDKATLEPDECSCVWRSIQAPSGPGDRGRGPAAGSRSSTSIDTSACRGLVL